MALHYKRMTSIAEAREYLAAGLLYENKVSNYDTPFWGLADYSTPHQLDRLESDPDYSVWPITDYAVLLED